MRGVCVWTNVIASGELKDVESYIEAALPLDVKISPETDSIKALDSFIIISPVYCCLHESYDNKI